ncbi:MAG: AAA family ATPase [Gemmobacter sp.]|uniref:AAA family ATPase n=1 Tax=Gemmobacter sp. TaxID=1898957 RepID=UPI001A5D5E6D|nr:AAA family ATPase [Gemmobacter sp.]MBL8562704.1 AAA family ATPase [Gemmobacter sp.]
MARKQSETRLPAPFLRQVRLRPEMWQAQPEYPFSLPFLHAEFALEFTAPVTILVGENGSGKSTLIEAMAALSGFDEAGGGQGYRPVDHAQALEVNGAALGAALRASWLPKVTRGWFFRAESFYAVARYLDEAARASGGAPPDFLSHSHGEGFLRVFAERMDRQGLYFLDEPESALSPKRQLELLRHLAALAHRPMAQVIMATHSPLLMAVPGAQVLEITREGVRAVDWRDTAHMRLYRHFALDPEEFLREALAGEI